MIIKEITPWRRSSAFKRRGVAAVRIRIGIGAVTPLKEQRSVLFLDIIWRQVTFEKLSERKIRATNQARVGRRAIVPDALSDLPSGAGPSLMRQ